MPLRTAARTDSGCVREHNEDAVLIDEEVGLLMVADGMGGHAAGEVASRIVCEEILRDTKAGKDLAAAVARVHHTVKQAAAAGTGKPGMGSTLVAAQATGMTLRVVWVGDSRAYLARIGEKALMPLTKDHSFVQKLMDAGAITEEEARAHPRRNLITQSLGADAIEDVEVGQTSVELQDGDCVLLCSDGLTGELTDDAIWRTVERWREEPESLAERLIEAAKEAGGSDNISVVVLWVEPEAGKATQKLKKGKSRLDLWFRKQWAEWLTKARKITKGDGAND